MQIIPATKSDIPAILPLWKKLMEDGGDETFQLNKDWKKHITAHIGKLLENDRAKILVAKERDVIIGYAIINIINNIPSFKQLDRGFITDLCVHEDHRSKGIGEKMLKEIFAWFKSKGIERVELFALEKNARGRKFWKRVGFEDYMHRMVVKI